MDVISTTRVFLMCSLEPRVLCTPSGAKSMFTVLYLPFERPCLAAAAALHSVTLGRSGNVSA